MLNRRQLRIKVLQATYAQLTGNNLDLIIAEKNLLKDIDRIYNLYLYYILTFPKLIDIAKVRIEENKLKIIKTKTDINPNLNFVKNKVFQSISKSDELRRISEERKINWISDEEQEIIRKLYYEIIKSELYEKYIEEPLSNFSNDKKFAKNLFLEIIANYSPILNYFEEKNSNWIDDIDGICKGIMKSISKLNENEVFEPSTLHKNLKDDIEFTSNLFNNTISQHKSNIELIDSLTSNWELDRIAKMDLILMSLAITELINFNSIPKKVTLNEYIEISKFYSTPKSHSFINGILDKAIKKLEKEGKLKKIGRGLIN